MSLADLLSFPVSGLMWLWYELLAPLLGPSNGATWTLSVVLLVATVRAAMIPLALAQARTARRSAAAAPELAALRERYAEKDPATYLAKAKEVRARNGMSTGSTLVPLFVQLPVFFALYHTLQGFLTSGANLAFSAADVAAFGAARLFDVPLAAGGLARPEVAFVVIPLLLASAAATWLSTRTSLRASLANGAPAVPGQGVMPWLAPLGVLAGGLVVPLPVAVLVYWVTTNAWTLVQQHLLTRIPVPAPAPRPVAVAPRPGAKPLRRKG